MDCIYSIKLMPQKLFFSFITKNKTYKRIDKHGNGKTIDIWKKNSDYFKENGSFTKFVLTTLTNYLLLDKKLLFYYFIIVKK